MVEMKENHKIIVMAVLLGICCFLAWYVHMVLGIEVIYTHFFYVPIILASLWWKRKGLLVAIFLAGLLLLTHLFHYGFGILGIDDLVRASFFIIVAYVIGLVSEKRAQGEEEIIREKKFTENIITTVPDSLLVLDKDLRVKSANRTFYEKFQTEPETVIGTRITEILGDEDGKLSKELTRLFGTEDMLENFELHYQSEKLGERIFNITARGILVAEVVVLEDITERKRAEKELKKSQESFHNVVERSADGIIIVDRNGIVRFVNSTAESLFGRNAEELVGELFGFPIVSGKSLEVDIIRRGEEPGVGEMRIVETEWNGESAYLVSIRDITERKAAEDALAASKAYTESIIQNFLDTLIVVDTEAKIQTVNPATIHLLGYTEEALIGQPVSIIFAEEEEEEEEEEDHRVFQFFREPEKAEALRPLDTIRNRELTYKTRDGRLIPMLFNASVLIDEADNVTGVVAGAKDITELKLAEAEIRREKGFSENIIATVPDSLLVLDADLRIKSANRSFYETFQTEPEKEIGSRITEILQDKDGRLSSELTRLFGTGAMLEDFELHYSSEKLGERIFNITARGILVAEEEEEEEEELIVLEDITERKRAEEKIEASLREKEMLLKEIHHRVKNNLQVVSSLLNLQSESIEDEHTLELFKISQTRINSMALIHEGLYQSEDLAGIDFAEYIEKLVAELYSLYGVNFETIKLNINADNILLGIDKAIPCGLIINELVSNSLKHAFPQGKEGEISVGFHSENDSHVLTVGDNGLGFPKNLDFRNTESLGMQLVVTLTNQLDGTIEQLDRSGGGTTFNITFAE